MEHAELTVTDEWNNLKEQLKATAELLNKTSGELSSVKSDLTNTRIDLAAAVMKLGEMNNELIKNLMKTNDELSNAKRDLTHTTNALEGTEQQELNLTKFELDKTKLNLSKNVDDLLKTINGTENGLAKLQIRTGNLSIELKTFSIRLGHERKVIEANLKNNPEQLRVISISLETTIANLNATRTELMNARLDVADLKSKLNARTREIVDIGQMSTSCSDLQRMGHKLSGFFSVKGSKKMKMVFCDFFPNQNDKQKWIGYTDVKSAPVHFYVQHNSPFDIFGIPIPFDLARHVTSIKDDTDDSDMELEVAKIESQFDQPIVIDQRHGEILDQVEIQEISKGWPLAVNKDYKYSNGTYSN
ncbi:hypothetical protein DAPPUDRAFT_320781 [Daphnia pulex]|uniref:Uncharacterized protein n=1 Tax=Daphnia pulex TaxID=6669 RepID=E9GR28_DAPPU|nr:hypothetical protein DAPPUDRAFT_320781 [Daphnia pulex]|eukprot:EFX77937.1 hypothetical protein DAPPUDRAFT_320781 [Daphnia pulex]